MSYFTDIQYIIEDRFKEINILRNLCKNSQKIEETTILKSSIVLLLYNTIEGSFSSILESLFNFISDNKMEITKLNKGLQKIYYKYYIVCIGNNPSEFSKIRMKPDLTDVSFKNITEKLKLFSGNLDAQKIREISLSIGIGIPKKIKKVQIGDKLLFIKNLRNKLAHGECSFSDACRDITLEEIDDICVDAKKFIDKVIERFSDFVETDKILDNSPN
jgi:hypothetical protein